MKKAILIGTMAGLVFSFALYVVVKTAEAAPSPAPSLNITMEDGTPPDYLGVVINGVDGTLSIYAATLDRIENKGTIQEDDPHAAAFSPDGTVLFVARGQARKKGRTGLVSYRISSDALSFDKELEWKKDLLLAQPTAMAVSPDSKLVAIADENDLLVYNLEQESLVYTDSVADRAMVTGVAFSPISNIFVTTSIDKNLRTYVVTPKEIVQINQTSTGRELTSIAFRPETNDVAVLDLYANRLLLYRIGGIQEGLLHDKQTGIRPGDVAFSPDGRLMAVVNEGDNMFRLYQFTEKGIKKKDIVTGQVPSSVAFSPDGKLMAVTSRSDNKLFVYPLKESNLRGSYGMLSTGKNPFKIVFSPLLGLSQEQIRQSLQELQVVPEELEQLIGEFVTPKK